MIIDDITLTGQFAEITYCPPDGSPIYLGYHELPFTWVTTIYDPSGSFSLYYPSLDLQCGECATTSTTTTTTLNPCSCISFSNSGDTEGAYVTWTRCGGGGVFPTLVPVGVNTLEVCGSNPVYSGTPGVVTWTIGDPCIPFGEQFFCEGSIPECCRLYYFRIPDTPGVITIDYVDCDGNWQNITFGEVDPAIGEVCLLNRSDLYVISGPVSYYIECPCTTTTTTIAPCNCFTLFGISEEAEYRYYDCDKGTLEGPFPAVYLDTIELCALSVEIAKGEIEITNTGNSCIIDPELGYVCPPPQCNCITFSNDGTGEFDYVSWTNCYGDEVIPIQIPVGVDTYSACGSNPVTSSEITGITWTIGDPCVSVGEVGFVCEDICCEYIVYPDTETSYNVTLYPVDCDGIYLPTVIIEPTDPPYTFCGLKNASYAYVELADWPINEVECPCSTTTTTTTAPSPYNACFIDCCDDSLFTIFNIPGSLSLTLGNTYYITNSFSGLDRCAQLNFIGVCGEETPGFSYQSIVEQTSCLACVTDHPCPTTTTTTTAAPSLVQVRLRMETGSIFNMRLYYKEGITGTWQTAFCNIPADECPASPSGYNCSFNVPSSTDLYFKVNSWPVFTGPEYPVEFYVGESDTPSDPCVSIPVTSYCEYNFPIVTPGTYQLTFMMKTDGGTNPNGIPCP